MIRYYCDICKIESLGTCSLYAVRIKIQASASGEWAYENISICAICRDRCLEVLGVDDGSGYFTTCALQGHKRKPPLGSVVKESLITEEG